MSEHPSEASQRAQAGKLPAPTGKPIIGVLGGIGSGKSQAAQALARCGGRIVSGDRLGHEALRQPQIRERIVRHWGPEVLDPQGEIDRGRLGRSVFADREQLKELEGIVHPWIEERIRAEIEEARRDPDVRLVVLDAAIMVEAGWHTICDKLVFVDVPRTIRLERIAQQRGWSEKEVQERERAQLPLTEKASRADHVLDNISTLAHLQHQADELLRLWGLTCPLLADEQGAGCERLSSRGPMSPPATPGARASPEG